MQSDYMLLRNVKTKSPRFHGKSLTNPPVNIVRRRESLGCEVDNRETF